MRPHGEVVGWSGLGRTGLRHLIAEDAALPKPGDGRPGSVDMRPVTLAQQRRDVCGDPCGITRLRGFHGDAMQMRDPEQSLKRRVRNEHGFDLVFVAAARDAGNREPTIANRDGAAAWIHAVRKQAGADRGPDHGHVRGRRDVAALEETTASERPAVDQRIAHVGADHLCVEAPAVRGGPGAEPDNRRLAVHPGNLSTDRVGVVTRQRDGGAESARNVRFFATPRVIAGANMYQVRPG